MPSPPLVVPNAVQIRLMYTLSGNSAFNVIHARKLGTQVLNQALANLIGSAIKSAWTTTLGPMMGISTGLAKVGIRDLSAANQPEYLDSGVVVTGTSIADPLPTNVASCVTLRTALSGKSMRGRVYLGGFTEAENENTATQAQTSADASTAFLEAVSDALTANGMTLGVLSRPSYSYVDNRTWTLSNGSTLVDQTGRGNARPGAINDVTLIQSRSNGWESQRRRNNPRGNAVALLSARSTREIRPANG